MAKIQGIVVRVALGVEPGSDRTVLVNEIDPVVGHQLGPLCLHDLDCRRRMRPVQQAFAERPRAEMGIDAVSDRAELARGDMLCISFGI